MLLVGALEKSLDVLHLTELHDPTTNTGSPCLAERLLEIQLDRVDEQNADVLEG